MLKILGLTNNYSKGYEYSKRLNSTRNKNSSKKSTKSKIPSSKKELSKFANDSTAKKKSRNKNSTKNSSKKNKNINSYQYIQQKALNYINAPVVNNINNNIINTNSNNKNKIKLISSICLNKNRKNIHKRKRVDDQSIKINNLTADKKIKEIKIKSNFNLSYINLFVNKSSNNNNDIQNQTTIGNNTRMATVSNINGNIANTFDDDNNDISLEKNKSFLNSISKGIYHRKIKIFNSSSIEKRPRKQKAIESIEITFSPKKFINKFQPYVAPQQNSFNDKKIK